jgi:hypothetical protein
MKKIVFIQCASFLVVLFWVNVAAAQSLKSSEDKSAYPPALNGAWQRVYYYNGKTTTTGEPKEFVVVYDGFFSSIGQDSSGSWSNTHAGTFEINGNLMKNHLLYSSHPERMGSIQWVEFELREDTLTMKWFKKLITPQGQDITAEMPKAESKYIRAKK